MNRRERRRRQREAKRNTSAASRHNSIASANIRDTTVGNGSLRFAAMRAVEEARMRAAGWDDDDIPEHHLHAYDEWSGNPRIRREQYDTNGIPALLPWSLLTNDEQIEALKQAVKEARELAEEQTISVSDEPGVASFDFSLSTSEYASFVSGDSELHPMDDEYWNMHHMTDERAMTYVRTYNEVVKQRV